MDMDSSRFAGARKRRRRTKTKLPFFFAPVNSKLDHGHVKTLRKHDYSYSKRREPPLNERAQQKTGAKAPV
jgi:hypothetical protein